MHSSQAMDALHPVHQTGPALLRLQERIDVIPQMRNAKIPSSLRRGECCRIYERIQREIPGINAMANQVKTSAMR